MVCFFRPSLQTLSPISPLSLSHPSPMYLSPSPPSRIPLSSTSGAVSRVNSFLTALVSSELDVEIYLINIKHKTKQNKTKQNKTKKIKKNQKNDTTQVQSKLRRLEWGEHQQQTLDGEQTQFEPFFMISKYIVI